MNFIKYRNRNRCKRSLCLTISACAPTPPHMLTSKMLKEKQLCQHLIQTLCSITGDPGNAWKVWQLCCALRHFKHTWLCCCLSLLYRTAPRLFFLRVTPRLTPFDSVQVQLYYSLDAASGKSSFFPSKTVTLSKYLYLTLLPMPVIKCFEWLWCVTALAYAPT